MRSRRGHVVEDGEEDVSESSWWSKARMDPTHATASRNPLPLQDGGWTWTTTTMASSSSSSSSFSASQCFICSDPLLVLSSEEDGERPVPDDVLLRCGHHVHWSCLLDAAIEDENEGRTKCGQCGASTRDASGRFIVTVLNEGG